MNHRVVITGLGFCTPVGQSRDEVWRNLLEGQSGIGPVTLFEASALPVGIGGEVKGLDLPALAARFPAARDEHDRKIWLGLAAASQAVQDAGLAAPPLTEALLHVGVSLEHLAFAEVVGAAQAEESGRALAQYVRTRGAARPLQTPLDRLTQLLGEHWEIYGGRYTNCSACAAGAQAVGEVFRHLRQGAATVGLAGATDSTLNPLGLGGFSLLRILSPENDQPTRACRPFDATRQGTVLSEGATFLVLENLDHAEQRGARVYAEVLGYGTSLDAYRVSDPAPTGRGAVLSMTRALADAGLRPEAIDSVNAHGTGTPKNDVVETQAIKQALGPRAREIPVNAIKSMTGHMIATSGAFEAAVSALTLFTGNIPPTINLHQADAQCDLDYVPNQSRPFAGRTVLSNSFGFGGQNATLIFSRVQS